MKKQGLGLFLSFLLTIASSNLFAQIDITANRTTICAGDTTQLYSFLCHDQSDDFNSGIDTTLWNYIDGGTVNNLCGSVSGNALRFDSSVVRQAAIGPKFFKWGGTVSFWLKISAGTVPCDDAEPGEDVIFQASKDGVLWFTLNTYDEANFDTFTLVTEVIPIPLWTDSTWFRWRQISHSGQGFDNWAIDDIFIACNGTGGPFTYLWTPTSAFNDSTAANPIVTADSSMFVYVTASDTDSSVLDTLFIIVDTLATTISADQVICDGDSVQLSSSSNLLSNYSWSPVAGLSCANCSNPKASPSTDTTYTLIISSGSCSDTNQVFIDVDPAPLPDAGPNHDLCLGDTITLTGSASGGTFFWSPSTGLDSIFILQPLAYPTTTTTYTLTLTSDSGCIRTDTARVNVDGLSGFTVEKARDTICAGDTTQLGIELPVTCEDYSYSTIDYDTITGTGTTEFLTDDDVAGPLPIGFNFTFYCFDYTEFYISSNGFITFSPDYDDGCCLGQSIPTAGIPDNLIAFAWNDLNPYNNTGHIEYFTTGVFPDRKLVINFDSVPHFGDSGLITVQIILFEQGDIIEIHTADMPGDGTAHTMGIENIDGTVGLTVSGRNALDWSASNEGIRFTPLGPDTTLQYSWTPTDLLDDSTAKFPVANPDTSTTYMVDVIENGCPVTGSITVYVTDLVITASNDTVYQCHEDSIQLGVSSNMVNTNNSWSPSIGLSCT
ncbi:MAG: hypothetical protein IH946_03935, partial [Bacteroidetes bacterium]|nr:hypothetical protein [Bacteroidota bacterium]